MTDPGTPQPGGRKTLPLLLIAIIAILLVYVIYRSTRPQQVPTEPPVATPGISLETPTAAPALPTPTTAALLTPTPEPPCRDWIVTVGPDPKTLNYPDICVGPTNRVVWTPSNNAGSLKIYFPISGYPKGLDTSIAPFLHMHLELPAQKDWVFNTYSPSSTNSGTPNPALPGAPGTSWLFKYDQQLGGTRADGRMIIKK